MISIHNIRTVANYEAKTLRRSWLFRLFSLGALAIIVIFNLALYSPIGDEEWEALAIPSSMPHMNLYLLNIAQAMIIIFLASDFLKRDKKLDTNEVLYTRPMSNLEYVTGKTLGILRLFIGLNLLVLLVCLIINLVARNTYVDIASYFESLLIIVLPTLIFSLGFAYLLMTIIRNQSITFLLLLGVIALNFFYLYFRAGSIFDYMLFGMPVLKSQIVGYSDIDMIIAHRLLYSFAGMAFILITVLLFKRLPQSRIHRILSISLMVLFMVGAVWSGYYFYSRNRRVIEDRLATTEVNRKYENENFLKVTGADIELDHRGNTISATAGLTCVNRSSIPVDKYYFSLNPGLEVTSVVVDDKPAGYTTDRHVIIIDDPSPLEPGAEKRISISYEGTIDEAFISPYYKGNIKDDPYRLGPLNVQQKQSFLEDDYLLLPSETYWYPSATLNYYPGNPARMKIDFTRYTLTFRTSGGLVPISQGNMTSGEDGTYLFENDTPQTGLSLVAGNYLSESIMADSVNFSIYYYPDHDYFRQDLNELGDTIGNLISNIMTELEINFNTSYPFSDLKLVEVPIQFHSTPKKNTQTQAEVQPAMILLPEKLAPLQDGGFYRIIKRQKRRMERSNQVVTEKELQVRAFNTFVRNTFISNSNFFFSGGIRQNTERYLLGPSYYFFKNNFYSNDYPVMNAVFESHLQKVLSPANAGRGMLGGLSESDRANTILRDISLRDLLALDPSNDTLRMVLTVKGDYLFNLMRAQAGMTEFNNWFTGYAEQNRFGNVEIEQFDRDLNEQFGFSILPALEDWYGDARQPGFYFTDTRVNEVVINNRTRYKVSFVAANPMDVPGIFSVSFRTGGMGPGGRGGGGMDVNITMSARGQGTIAVGMRGMGNSGLPERVVMMDANQARRISLLLDTEPRAMLINTIFSINNPGEITLPLMDVEKGKSSDPSTEDEILSSLPAFIEANEIIVDNEDPGFRVYQAESTGRLKKMLGINRERGNDYMEMFGFWAPEYWQKTVQSNYYGEFVRSAVYTRSGTGERYVSWTTPITEPGYYDIYTYIGRQGGARMVEGPGGGRGRQAMQDLHYRVEHDDGTEEVTLEFENAENGWNMLGSYYLSPDSATVILTNASGGRSVSGDAIKWIKQNSSK